MVEKIMAATPRALGGHDQDWDDAITAANKAALFSQCRPSIWERAQLSEYQGEFTGRWKYSEQVAP